MKLSVPDYILSIAPYTPGKPIDALEREMGIKNTVKLASNENPLGPSPMAVNAVKEHISSMNRYPDGSGFKLTAKLAEKYGVRPENVIIGNGSDDIISLLAQAFLSTGKEAVMPVPSFLMYEISVKSSGGRPVMVPLKGLSIDLDALSEAVTENTAMVFVTNPNNPTGTTFTTDEFQGLMAKLPEDILVVVDEAYIEFVRDTAAFNCLSTPLSDSRLVCLRTFSKAYGLAGFRVGYGIMDEEIAQILHRVRQPFNVNSLAQVAAAAALDDEEFLEKSLSTMHQGIDFLREELLKMGVTSFPTEANFFLIDVGQDATEVFNDMLKHGVITRSMKSYGYDTFLRISAGLEEENRLFLNALKKVLNLSGQGIKS